MATARELLERFFAYALRGDGAAFGALFAPNGTLEHPFAHLRFVGRAAIADRAQRTWAASPFLAQRFELTELIESGTGLTAEYVVHGIVRATGASARVGGITVLESEAGELVAMREYLDPVALRAVIAVPREVLHRYHAAMRAKDADALADLYAPDAIHEFSFFTPNRPPQLVGREAIRASYREGWANHPLELETISDTFVEDGTDPEVVIGQWRATGSLRATGSPVAITGLLALRVRAGLIVHTRDFMDALGIAHALGRMPFSVTLPAR